MKEYRFLKDVPNNKFKTIMQWKKKGKMCFLIDLNSHKEFF